MFGENFRNSLQISAAAPAFRVGGTRKGVGLVGGPGAEPLGCRRISENFQKFLKKIAKITLF